MPLTHYGDTRSTERSQFARPLREIGKELDVSARVRHPLAPLQSDCVVCLPR